MNINCYADFLSAVQGNRQRLHQIRLTEVRVCLEHPASWQRGRKVSRMLFCFDTHPQRKFTVYQNNLFSARLILVFLVFTSYGAAEAKGLPHSESDLMSDYLQACIMLTQQGAPFCS
jgi:hypothetical protein